MNPRETDNRQDVEMCVPVYVCLRRLGGGGGVGGGYAWLWLLIRRGGSFCISIDTTEKVMRKACSSPDNCHLTISQHKPLVSVGLQMQCIPLFSLP